MSPAASDGAGAAPATPLTDARAARQHYDGARLSEAEFLAPGVDPVALASAWVNSALAAQPGGGPAGEPNAMALATADADGRPNVRIVLLKEITAADGFVFFTNYESRKGRELEARPWAAATFYWPGPPPRCLRVRGPTHRLTDAQNDAYFHSRPRPSRASAIASRQSQPTEAAREPLAEAAKRELDAGELRRPPTWGGYGIVPEEIEFWQGGPGRMHDRFAFSRQPGQTEWTAQRLFP